MKTLDPVPKVGDLCWFFANDQIKKTKCYRARVLNIYTQKAAEGRLIYKYDEWEQEVVPHPLIDFWILETMDLFWILAEETDFILELSIPSLTGHNVYAARTVDGGWHSFETLTPIQFGIVDVTGEQYKLLEDN